MVWDIQAARTDWEYALRAYLLKEMETRGATMASHTRERCGDVARGVATYCADDAGRGLCVSELHALCSRALWSVGETDIACRILDDHLEGRCIRDTLKTLLSLQEVSPLLWRAVVRGVVRRRMNWATSDGMPIWVLDLARLDTTPCDLELARFMMVRTLLRAMASVWMASGGIGVMVVRMRGATRREIAVLLDLCRDALDRERAHRKWRTAPRVWHGH